MKLRLKVNSTVTRLYDGLTYLQNNKVDFRFYQLLKDLFKYNYVEADILNPCVIYKKLYSWILYCTQDLQAYFKPYCIPRLQYLLHTHSYKYIDSKRSSYSFGFNLSYPDAGSDGVLNQVTIKAFLRTTNKTWCWRTEVKLFNIY